MKIIYPLLETPSMNLAGLFLVAAGIFSVCGAALDWDFFMNNYKARFLVKIFGRNGARIFYGILGLGIAVVGTLVTFGIIEQSS